jgi:thiol:disulfide interchange protein DsbA
MKKIFGLLFALAFSAGAVAAGPYEEGTHYEVIAETGTAKPEIKEFFSFYCPHCHTFEPVVKSVEKSLPAGTQFKKYHVDFMGGATPEVQSLLTKTMILAKLKGKGPEVNAAIFKHIHIDRKAFANLADIREVVTAAGFDGAVFDKEIENFMVKNQAKLMQKEQNDLSKRRVMNGVPTFIVNGRYKIITAKLDQANLEQDMKGLINYLLTK